MSLRVDSSSPTFESTSCLALSRFRCGSPIPFGAEVVDENDVVVGYAGQQGRAFVRLSDGKPRPLTVRWSDGAKCALDWNASAATHGPESVSLIQGQCHAN